MTRAHTVYAVVVAALACITLASPHLGGRFELAVEGLAVNADFTDGWTAWRATPRGATGIGLTERPPRVVRLLAAGIERPVWLATRLEQGDQPYTHIRVRAELRAENIAVGKGRWQDGRVRLLGSDGRGRRLDHWPSVVATARGSTPWTAHVATVPVNPRARTTWLFIQLIAREGALLVRGVEVDGVVERPGSMALDAALSAGWVAVWIWAGVALVRRARGAPVQLVAVAVGTLVVVLGTMPQPYYEDSRQQALRVTSATLAASAATLAGARERLRAVWPAQGPPERSAAAGAPRQATDRASAATADATPAGEPESSSTGRVRRLERARRGTATPSPEQLDSVPDGAGHLLAFTVLALVTGLGYRSASVAARASALLALSASIQTAQALSLGRNPDLADMTADVLGIAAGTVLAASALAILRAGRARLRGA